MHILNILKYDFICHVIMYFFFNPFSTNHYMKIFFYSSVDQFLDLDINLVADESLSSVLPDPSASPASSISSDSTIILSSTKNRKRGQTELDRDQARQVKREPSTNVFNFKIISIRLAALELSSCNSYQFIVISQTKLNLTKLNILFA